MSDFERKEDIAPADWNALQGIAQGYDPAMDFDGILSRYAGRLIASELTGARVLECGPAYGLMTATFIDVAAELEVVEPADVYAEALERRFGTRLRIHRCLLEAFAPDRPFEAIVMTGILHHIGSPVDLLCQARKWVVPGGRLFATVPNMLSFHRRLGVSMGLVETPYATSDRNRLYRQPGRFDRSTFCRLVEDAGWTVTEASGFFIKPFPHNVMEQLPLSEALLDGLFKLGREMPDFACQIFLTARSA